MPAIEYQKTPTTKAPWDAGVARKHLKEDQTKQYYEKEFAWVDGESDGTHKGDYKFPHHQVDTDGTIGDANLNACQSAIDILNGGMGGSQIPAADHEAVHAHLAHHLKDANPEKEVTPLKKSDNAPKNLRSMTIPVKFRAAADGKPATVSGHAAVFNSLSQPLWELGYGREMIAPGAFSRAISEPDDIRLLINHDANLVLARNISGTLSLKEDEVGLYFEAQLGDQSYAKDLQISMERGDITGCSFAFTIDDAVSEVQDGENISIIKAASLSDVSIVTYPAYLAASASLRGRELFFKNIRELNKNENTSGSPEEKHDSANRWSAEVTIRERELEILKLQ